MKRTPQGEAKAAVKGSGKAIASPLQHFDQKSPIIGKFKGKMIGLAQDHDGYRSLHGVIALCTIAQQAIEMHINCDGHIYTCTLHRLPNAINGFSGKWKCGVDDGPIAGRVIPDVSGYLFVGVLTDELKFDVFAQLWE